MIRILPYVVLLLAGCSGPGHVEFTDGHCIIDGRAASVSEVEARQASISERIVGRQPLFVVVTILIVVLAGFSHIEKLFLLFSARRSEAHGLGARLKVALERYRVHPVRYFAIVGVTLALLGCAGGFYVYLDADKRASERALGLLQFCHLALRNNEAEGILAEQRNNLQAIQTTAADIHSLVDKLPPEEQRKAREIVGRINTALDRQNKLVGDYVTKTAESTKTVLEHTQTLERGLSSLETGVSSLKPVPAALKDIDGKLMALKTQLDTVGKCPACNCSCNCAQPPLAVDGGAARKAN